TASEKTKQALNQFQGKWAVVKAQEGQEEFDAKELAKFPITISGDQMEVVHEAEKMVKLTIRIRPDAAPKEIDAQFPAKGEQGRVLRGIYRFDDGMLTLALVARHTRNLGLSGF